jgi:acyl-CoA synthetase (AMP-forming)/AMP-acid ligase II
LAAAGTDAINMATIIVDDQDHEVGPGTVGEIVTRGPCVMNGYWQNDDATDEALRNGWMHTGDAGYRSDDGYVFVTDRIKDMIVSGGENVYPREVEDVLFAHDAVLEAAVIGVPDDRWGERVHAVVVFHPGSEVAEQRLLEYCRENLAGYKVPRSVETASELPKNATGKVLKTELRAPHWQERQRGIN